MLPDEEDLKQDLLQQLSSVVASMSFQPFSAVSATTYNAGYLMQHFFEIFRIYIFPCVNNKLRYQIGICVVEFELFLFKFGEKVCYMGKYKKVIVNWSSLGYGGNSADLDFWVPSARAGEQHTEKYSPVNCIELCGLTENSDL
jgi:hypothetical protein